MARTILGSILLAVLAAATTADAGQRLIGPGDAWDLRAGDVAPGDEIVLMPGRHQPARLVGVQGAPGKPIVIRSFSADRRAVIDGGSEAICLEGARHIVVRDIDIEGAAINGITIAPPAGHDDDDGAWRADVRLYGVSVARTGPTGKRHGMHLRHVSHVHVEQCVVEGWGGAGIDITASEEIVVSRCTFRGLDDHGQRSAVHVRGGSRRVRIVDSTMIEAGVFAVTLGGADDPPLTVTGELVANPAPRSAAHDVANVEVARCLIRGGGCPLHFLSAAECRARNLTIIGPRHGVIAIDVASEGRPILPSTGLRVGQCLIVWAPSDPERLFRTGPRFGADTLTLGANLWWAPGPNAGAPVWPSPPATPQLVDVDPNLDPAYDPRAAAATLYGLAAP